MGGARVALVASEVWLLTAVAHAAAGGELPAAPWLVGLGALVVLATAWVLRSRVAPWLVAGGLAVAQLGLHIGLHVGLSAASGSTPHAATAMRGHAHHDPAAVTAAASAPGLLDDLSTRMVVAHVLSALVTGFVWWLRRRVVAVVLRVGRPAVVVGHRAVLGPAPSARRPHPRPWLLGDLGRAPPRAYVAA